jgi:hypothetical protein
LLWRPFTLEAHLTLGEFAMDSNFQSGSKVSTHTKLAIALQRERAGYAAILLREFNNLVALIMLLDEKEVKRYDAEINFAVDQLNSWCETMSPNHTLKVLFVLKRLQQVLGEEKTTGETIRG